MLICKKELFSYLNVVQITIFEGIKWYRLHNVSFYSVLFMWRKLQL